ncbi:hypothetical protein MBLNU459_g8329t1 [Dothideomycetes sp. NU459]
MDLLQAYTYGCAFWYTVRGAARIYDPLMVIGWFRPPSQQHLAPNDLEIYNVWTDAWGLITIALLMLALSGTAPFMTSPGAVRTGKVQSPYAKAVVLVTMFHHVTTAIGAYQHYAVDTHYTTAMWIGVWVNVGLTAVGAFVLLFGMGGASASSEKKTT